MAAKNNKRSDVVLLLPPLKGLCPNNTRQTSGKPFGNFGSCVMLPAVDATQNINVFYGVKRICKFVCEWYLSWRPWQKEILLCSLSGKCSVGQLSSLSTILEPVFHRDFVSRLHGRYPVKDMRKIKKQKNKTKRGKDVQDRQEKAGKITFNQEEIVNTEEKEDEGLQGSKNETECLCENAVIIKVELDDQPISLTELIKQSIPTKTDNHQSVPPSVPQEKEIVEPPLDSVPLRNLTNQDQRACHTHTADIYKKDSTRMFFSASQLRTLSDMKANLQSGSKSKVGRRLSDLDAKCYKHEKWWTNGANSKRLISAHGSKLWNHFSRQLKEINEIMDNWGDPERVNLLSEVIKSSEPEQISLFAQCLIQRLRDRTDVCILPDRTLLKIFLKLDAKTLCQVSQVSRRWRYLGEDTNLWKTKCFQLGWSKGIKNLVVLIEKSANNYCIDWKQAYQEVYEIFQEKQVVPDEPPQVTGINLHPTGCGNVDNDDWRRGRQRREYLASKIIKGRSDVTLERQRIKTPKCEIPHEADAELPKKHSVIQPCKSKKDIVERTNVRTVTRVTEELDDNDITGGNLQLLEESLIELTEGRRTGASQEELALDVRPLKIQAKNELDKTAEEEYQQMTVAVEDVKSVKRVRKIQGHMDGVFCVQFDTKRCLTGSADRVLRMWDVRSGKGIRKIFGHSGGIRCLQFDSTKIMSGSWDSTIMIWDIVKFTRLGVLYGHMGCVSCLKFNSKHIISGSHDKTIRVWDVTTWECLHVLEGHQDEVTCLCLSGRVLLTGSTDRTIKLWNIVTGQCLDTLVGHESSVLSLKSSRALVISGSEDGKIMFWNIESGQREAAIEGHDGPCHCLFIWRSHFLSGGGDHIIKEWDISTLTCLRSLQGHQGPVYCIEMNTKRIVSSSEDGTVRVWDLEVPVQQVGINLDDDDKTLLPLDTLDCEDGAEGRRYTEEQFWESWRTRPDMTNIQLAD